MGKTKAIVRRARPGALVRRGTRAQRLRDAFLGGLGEKTLRAYMQDLADLAAFLGLPGAEQTIEELLAAGQGGATEMVMAYKASLLDRGLASTTINRRLAAVRSMIKLGRRMALISWAVEVPNVRTVPYRDTRGPGLEFFRAMLEAAAGDSPKAARDVAMLRLMYELTLRCGAVVGLDLEHLDMAAGTVRVLRKGERERTTMTLAGETVKALWIWLEHRPAGKGPLFTSLDHAGKGSGRLTESGAWYMVRKYGKLAGVTTHPHGLRHTGASEGVERAPAAGIGIDEVRQLTGHKDVKTLMIYRDQRRNVQGQLSELIANAAPTPARHGKKRRAGRKRSRRRAPVAGAATGRAVAPRR